MTRDCQPAACHYGRSLRVTLYIALALAGTPLASAQNASNDTSFGVAFLRATYPKHDWEHPVRFVLEPVGPTRSWTPPAHLFRKVKTDEDQVNALRARTRSHLIQHAIEDGVIPLLLENRHPWLPSAPPLVSFLSCPLPSPPSVHDIHPLIPRATLCTTTGRSIRR